MIITPPFTEMQKEVIEATKKLSEEVLKHQCDDIDDFEPITNYDRITASPEALTEFMDWLSNACIDCGIQGENYYNDNCPFGKFGNCADKSKMLEWLKQESDSE